MFQHDPTVMVTDIMSDVSIMTGSATHFHFLFTKKSSKERSAGTAIIWLSLLSAFYLWPLLLIYVIGNDKCKIFVRRLTNICLIMLGISLVVYLLMQFIQ